MPKNEFVKMRDGSSVRDRRMGRLIQEDPRNKGHNVARLLRPRAVQPLRSYQWGFRGNNRMPLDQGPDGACVGFGLTALLIARPSEWLALAYKEAMAIYHLAQHKDPWAGGAYPGADPFYEGTSSLAGAKALLELEYISSYEWAFTVEDMKQGVAWRGPCGFATDWTSGMSKVDAQGFMGSGGYLLGGHFYAILGICLTRQAFMVQNSWGTGFGVGGRAWLRFSDAARLLANSGEAIFLTENTPK